jgi:prolipoprotein diacylglyceryl transferase
MAPVWDLDPVLFRAPSLGLAVRYYGLIFSVVFLGGFLLFRWRTLKTGGDEGQAYDVIIPGFIGLLVGARLGHVLFYNLDYLRRDPWWVFKVWEGGLTSHGAAIGLILAMWWYARRHKLPFLLCADRFTFSAALGASLVRLGNFLNSEIVGKVTDAFWAVRFPRYDNLPPELTPPRYPSQLVEFAMGLGVLGILLAADRRLGPKAKPQGVLTALFLLSYFTGRFLVEFLKERQSLTDNLLLSRGQILSLPGMLAGLILLVHLLRKKRTLAGSGEDKAPVLGGLAKNAASPGGPGSMAVSPKRTKAAKGQVRKKRR